MGNNKFVFYKTFYGHKPLLIKQSKKQEMAPLMEAWNWILNINCDTSSLKIWIEKSCPDLQAILFFLIGIQELGMVEGRSFQRRKQDLIRGGMYPAGTSGLLWICRQGSRWLAIGMAIRPFNYKGVEARKGADRYVLLYFEGVFGQTDKKWKQAYIIQ